MKESLVRKYMIVGIIFLFVGAGIIPNVIGNVGILKDKLWFDNETPIICEEVHVTYSFQKPTIETVNIAGTIYDRIVLSDLDPAGKPGEPMIPAKGAYILLPPNSKISNIDIKSNKKQILDRELTIEPMGKSIPITKRGIPIVPAPDESIYNSDTFYPGELYSKVGKYCFRGYQILVLLLYPIQYNPVDKDLYYYEELDVSIEMVSSEESMGLFRGLEKDSNELITKVDNPDDVNWYNEKIIQSSSFIDEYDLLILTTDTFKESFESLKQAHDEDGVSTVIKTLTDVGGKNPEDIRDYIIDAYTNLGIDYVLLGGDSQYITAKMIFVDGMDEDQWYTSNTMPCDLYYSCLDGDGPGGGSGEDLIAEVYVGRACVDSIDDVNTFVTKTITYMDKTRGIDDYLDKIILAGEYKGDYGIASFGGNYLDQLIDGSSDDGYTTVGIPSDGFNIDTLYDRDLEWPPEDIIDRMESGVHIISHTGHSNYYYNMKMNYDSIDYIDNQQYPFFAWSTGCMAGGFDRNDCFAEHFTVKKLQGAFAGIWNARWGFFWSYRTDGDSQRYLREFWDAVFGEGIYVISKANQDSREDNLHLINRSCMRFVYFELNLFGDPAIAFHISYPPLKPATLSGPTSGQVEASYSYSSSTTDPEGDQIWYKWDWEDEISEWIGPFDSGDTVNASHVWDEKGKYSIKVKAKDVHGEESPWSDPLAISMPRNKVINSFLLFLERLIERFPMLEQII
jgi:hypothetical protein